MAYYYDCQGILLVCTIVCSVARVVCMAVIKNCSTYISVVGLVGLVCILNAYVYRIGECGEKLAGY